jgi:probable rRNA maturation factor
MKQHRISVKAPQKGLIPFENYRALFKSVGIAMLGELQADLPCEISLRFEDGEGIRALNSEFRGVDKVTDVLSFPLCDLTPGDRLSEAVPEWELENGYASLGDVVICVPRMLEQAAEFGHSPEREGAFLFTHSILHLFGYDHPEGGEPDGDARTKQEAALARMGLSRESARAR